MDSIVILGFSGHAKVVVDVVEQEGRYRIAGLVDRNGHGGDRLLGYDVLGHEEDVPLLVDSLGLRGAIVAVGDNFVREAMVARLRQRCPDLPFVTALHPRACVARDVPVGEGSVVMAGVVVNPGSAVGRHCILGTNASLGHDSVMEEFASLAPRVATGGNCGIGAFAAVGIGAVLIHGVSVGEHSVVGAGSTVVDDVDPHRVVYGTPAREIRERAAGDRYL